MPHEGETKTWLETEHGDQISIQGICSIGRAESNNIILNKGVVSRHHAVIHERDKEYWIVDLGGVNGFLVNGTRVVQPVRLRSGDHIQIPSADFTFHHGPVPTEAPAPAAPKPTPPLEPPLTVTPAPALPVFDTSTPFDVTVPLPNLVKPKPPVQQDELPLGLPAEASQTSKLKKPRVYVGPMDTRGLPRVTLPSPTPIEEVKPFPAVAAAKPSTTSHLPRQSEDALKVTLPLHPPLTEGKPKEMKHIAASDVIVTPTPKPKSPPALPAAKVEKADSFLQPSTAQEAASSTKSIAPPRRTQEASPAPLAAPLPVPATPKEAAPLSKIPQPSLLASTAASADTADFLLAPPTAKEAVPVSKPVHTPAPAKPEEEESFSSIVSPPPMLPSAEVKDRKKFPKGPAPVPAKKIETVAKPEIKSATDSAATEGLPAKPLCPAAKQSQYIGLASIFLPFIGVLTAVVAIVLGHSALRKIQQSNGSLGGRESAVMGLKFGYISLVLIAGYSTLVYFLFLSPSKSVPVAHTPTAPTPIVITPDIPSPAPKPALMPPADSTATPAPATTAVVTPLPTDIPPAPRAATHDVQLAPPPTPAPEAPSPAPTPTPDVAKMPAPETPPPAPTVPDVTTPPPAVTTPAPAATAPSTPPAVISDSTGGNAAALLQSPDTNAAPAPATPPAASTEPLPLPPAGTPAVYNADVQNRLKDGMLAQPIPPDTSSRAYMDAESFNNCARILARPPEAKYAESVGDFLEDVKKRNPDPVRLQILSAMFENYMAGIKRDF